MPTLEPAFDAIIADLPYGTTACEWDSVIDLAALWVEYKRLIKQRGAVVLFGAQPFTSVLVTSNLTWFKWGDVWDKKHPKGHLNAKIMPLRRHEDALIFGEGKITYNPQTRTGKFRKKGGGNPLSNKGVYGFHHKPETFNDVYYPTSILEFSNANQAAKKHPNQKPEALMAYLIRTYTNPGEIILDNTMGSGTTLVAAQNEGRRAVGIELSEDYCKIAVERLRSPSFWSIPESAAALPEQARLFDD
jgi:site-specific DNA-methyltransferase (adenine-specific)